MPGELLKGHLRKQPPPSTGHHCSAPFDIPCIDMCAFKTPGKMKDTSISRTVYYGPSGVLTMEVSLYRTIYCGPSGVLIMEVSLYRTIYWGLNGVPIIEVSL